MASAAIGSQVETLELPVEAEVAALPEKSAEVIVEEKAVVEKDEETQQDGSADRATKPMPQAELEELYLNTRASLERFQMFESTSQKIIEVSDFDWRYELRTLSSALLEEKNSVAILCSLLEKVLEKKRTDSEEETEAKNGKEDNSDPPSKPANWKIHYVSWPKIARGRSAGNFTIIIPWGEPSAADVVSAYRDHPIKDTDPPPAWPERLPERIQINSGWLRRFLDFDVLGRQYYGRDGPINFLRPFKFLVFYDTTIRNRLSQLEAARKDKFDMTEDEYIQEYEKDPVSDSMELASQTRINEENLSLSELTVLIMNCRQLVEFMDKTLKPEQERIASCPESVYFNDLWYLFPLGSVVYIKDKEIPQKCWKVANRTGGRRYLEPPSGVGDEDYKAEYRPFVLDCFYIEHDGTVFVPVYKQFQISDFEDLRAVHTLPVVPFSVAEMKGMVRDRATLLERSAQYMKVARAKMSHLHYSGRSIARTPDGLMLSGLNDVPAKKASCYSERIDSEVIVDFRRAFEEVPGWRPQQKPDHTFGQTDDKEFTESHHPYADNDGGLDYRLRAKFMEGEDQKLQNWNILGSEPTDPSDLLILPDQIFAYVLKSRRWSCLQIGIGADGEHKLKKLAKQEEPWKRLELPDGHRDIVQSLIDSHFSKDKAGQVHFDLVKNKGVIILLHGVPGVGKTSTAECAAMHNDRPLLPITCGDLGLTPGEVEENLQDVFRLAQDWDCIMLLDEADIFLAQRTVTDHERNALVSVFLRTLEYYEGVLFLTTNRVGVFDEAFKSRIHMSLYYPPLDYEKTKKIWETHIEKAREAGITIDDVNRRELLRYAEEIYSRQTSPQYGPVWNGRQIRNAFQSALALAAFSTGGRPIELRKTFFEDVFEVSNKFSNYIWTTKQGQTDADLNRMFMTRRDDYNYNTSGMPGSGLGPHIGVPPIQRADMFPRSTFGQGIMRPTTPFGTGQQQQQQTQQFQQLQHLQQQSRAGQYQQQQFTQPSFQQYPQQPLQFQQQTPYQQPQQPMLAPMTESENQGLQPGGSPNTQPASISNLAPVPMAPLQQSQGRGQGIGSLGLQGQYGMFGKQP